MESRSSWNSKSFGRVGVLMGGWSSEREISLRSGSAVLAALRKLECEAIPIDLQGPSTLRETIQNAQIQAAFIALHGPFGEDGGIQALLEQLGIPYTGSGVDASRRAMDKVSCRKILTDAGIQMPEGVVAEMESGMWKVESGDFNFHSPLSTLHFPLPWVVKPSREGSSIGISIVDEVQELPKALERASRYSRTVIIERYIKGQEITVGILQDQPLPPVEIVPKNRFYDYESKYVGPTEYLIPARLDQERISKAKEIAHKTHNVLGCRNFSRVDMIAEEGNGLYVLELNTIPGFTDKSLLPKAARACGISFEELCARILESALETNAPKKTEDNSLSNV